MLGPRDALAHPPRRILIAGVTGVGKSTLAKRIAALLDLPYTEIDSLWHGPNWTIRDEFVADVDAATGSSTWIMEWQYREARPLLAERADTLVWLDYSAPVALFRVIRRTICRRRSREVLWNGNVEGPLWRVFSDPNHIIRWALSTQFKYKTSIPKLAESSLHLQVVRIRNQRQLERWLRSVLISSGPRSSGNEPTSR
jgi:adenylate kinase family enzyme